MEVNSKLVDELSNLAKLTFAPLEKEEIITDLQKMISFIEKLSEVDTSGVEPLLFMTKEVNVLREDVVTDSMTRDEGLFNAPLKDDQYFKVPKVIKR